MLIRELRERANLTQADLAGSIGVSQATVSDWERRVSQPEAKRLPALAAALGVSIDALFGEQPEVAS